VEIRPFRRDPLLVAEQTDLRVDALMKDLSGDELGQQRLPSVALGMVAHLAAESLVAQQESLR
jgi:hypothetical protein